MMFRNHEHYYDPTAGSACANICRCKKIKRKMESGEFFMKWIYIASPFRGDTDVNTMRAKRYARFVAKHNAVPVCPHIYLTLFLDDSLPEERKAGMYLGIQMLKRCQEIWVFGSTISEGMQKEIDFAIKNKIRIRYFDNACKEVLRDGEQEHNSI